MPIEQGVVCPGMDEERALPSLSSSLGSTSVPCGWPACGQPALPVWDPWGQWLTQLAQGPQQGASSQQGSAGGAGLGTGRGSLALPPDLSALYVAGPPIWQPQAVPSPLGSPARRQLEPHHASGCSLCPPPPLRSVGEAHLCTLYHLPNSPPPFPPNLDSGISG